MQGFQTPNIRDLGHITNLEVLNQFVSVNGKRVVDAGCGSMVFSELLAQQGADVFALDPDPVQAEKNRANPIDGVTFIEAGADRLPIEDDSCDGIFFSYSLHHIPADLYPQVFSEVRRVLHPDGFLYVIEPIDCPLNQVMKHFHDEDAERDAAQSALREIAIPMFEAVEFVKYHNFFQYESFEHFAERFENRSFNTYQPTDVRSPQVRDAFELHGAPDYLFESPKIAAFYKKLRMAE